MVAESLVRADRLQVEVSLSKLGVNRRDREGRRRISHPYGLVYRY
jgi:hypothetical protein